MAGHSHWAGIKHKKGKADKARSNLFSKLSREITVAAKLGDKNPDMNARLRSAIQSARSSNMPKDNIQKVWKLLSGYKNTKARFKSVLSLNINGKTFFFEGKIEGKIIFKQKGVNGFGYDSIFIPNGYTKTLAEINLIEKNKISHRSKALKRLINFLDKQKYL